ncbi:MAG: hypothetical protein ACOX2V_03890 [Clostridia bacterium]
MDEIRYADCILHVIDGASKDADMQMNEVYSILKSIGAGHIPVIEVVNKTDLVKEPLLQATSYPRAYISCVTGEGMETLLDLMDQAAKDKHVYMKLNVDYADGKLLSFIHSNAKILSKRDKGEDIEMEIEISAELVSKLDI